MKRKANDDGSAPKSHKSHNEYCGYIVKEGDCILSESDIDAFRLQFIDARKPVKLTCSAPVAINDFRLDAIIDTLQYEGLLQVERKVNYGFGLGKTREHLTLPEIVDKLKNADDSYYLTTQYEEDNRSNDEYFGTNLDENESSDEDDIGGEPLLAPVQAGPDSYEDGDDDLIDFSNLHDDFENEGFSADDDDNVLGPEEMELRVSSLFQPPLTNLVNKELFLITPLPFRNLVTQQINLWMGSAAKIAEQKPDFANATIEGLGKYVPLGNSSGLHHDHADNLYVLIQGKKRFTLYLPADAASLYTVGNINKVYANGLIDYQVDGYARLWRPMREDGAIKAEWAKWALDNRIVSEFTEEQLKSMIENEPEHNGEIDASLDPPSFSRVPPLFAHLDEIKNTEHRTKLEDLADTVFPGFCQLPKLEVWLESGDMLYIPTGWFHEVTSFADENNQNSAHIALNWWFMPPSRKIDDPYVDRYWNDDYEMTQLAISIRRDHTEQALTE